MLFLQNYLGEKVEFEISGGIVQSGYLIDFGSDIIVVQTNNSYLYIPQNHLQNIKHADKESIEYEIKKSQLPIDSQDEKLSYRKVLNNAKGVFVEIYIGAHQSLHGYLTSIMNDYFIFYSPLYNIVYISIEHVKFLIPYSFENTPYALGHHSFPVNPSIPSLSRTFEQQIKKLEGKLTVFDLGQNPNKIGQLKKIDNGIVELITANGEMVHWNSKHIKTVHFP